MRYRIHQIKLSPGEELSQIPALIRQKLRMPKLKIHQWKIVRKSVDARDKENIKMVYSVEFSSSSTLKKGKDCQLASEHQYIQPYVEKAVEERPLIVGFGPCGIFAGLILARAGLRPIILERGKGVPERWKDVRRYWKTGVPDPDSNVQFGEGGAGTFSDGKLTTGTHDVRIEKVLEEFVYGGADEEIFYMQKPHLGTDVLSRIIPSMRKEIENAGGEIRFNSRMESIRISNGTVEGVKIIRIEDEKEEIIEGSQVILAIGHSGRDTFIRLKDQGILMEPKPFSMGVRIRHLQEDINRAQYGESELAKILGPAEYKLSHRCKNGRGVYTFCMCPGGEIISAGTEEGMMVVNGMSYHARDGFYANSGLLVDVRVEDFAEDTNPTDPLAGIRFQRKYERLAFIKGGGRPPETVYSTFGKSKVAKSLPDFVVASILEAMPYMGEKLKGFDNPEALMVGVETRSSSPLRILRNCRGESNVMGLYPAGEGAGYAGGIVSAAVDGIRAAERVIEDIKGSR